MNKKITLALAVALVAGTAFASTTPAARFSMKKSCPTTAEQLVEARRAAFAKASESVRTRTLPGHETLYQWNAETSTWDKTDETTYTYDKYGNILTSVNGSGRNLNRISYTYDNLGRMVCRVTDSSTDGGKTWKNYQRRDVSYDDVVTDFITGALYYQWNSGEWVLSMGNTYPITRNENGVTIKTERTAWYQNVFDPIDRINCQTNEEGTVVTSFTVDHLEAVAGVLEWNQVIDMRNVKWANTDNQVLNFDIYDYAFGRNRIGAATLFYDDKLDAVINGVYPNDFEGSMVVDFVNEGRDFMEMKYAYTDAATGSYTYTSFNDFAKEDGTRLVEVKVETKAYDEHGNITEDTESLTVNGMQVNMASFLFSYKYNEQGGAEETIMSFYDPDLEDYVSDLRIVADDFHTYASVATPEADSSIGYRLQGRTVNVACNGNTVCTVLSLDGKQVAAASGSESFQVSLDNLASGIYIVRVSSATETTAGKVYVH